MPAPKTKPERSISEKLKGTIYESKLAQIRDIVKKEWKKFKKIKNINLYPFPSHDHEHCASTEKMLDELIFGSDKDDSRLNKNVDKILAKLSQEEVFLLIAATWLHDIGMQPKLLTKDENEDISDPKAAQKWFQKVRSRHAQRSAEYIDENIDKLQLNDFEYIEILKAMCKAHGHRAHQALNRLDWFENNVRVQLLVAYQRLADALHIPQKPDTSKFKKFLSLGVDTVSRFHWLRSRYAEKIECDPENFEIIIVLKKPGKMESKKIEPLVLLIRQTLRDELDSVKEILSKGGVTFYSKVECVPHPKGTRMNSADQTELNLLLANLQLYDTTMTPSARSVIDNVFHQINVFLGPESNPEPDAIKYLNSYLGNALKDILEQRPCYVFLRKVYILLDTILGSKENDTKKVELIRKEITDWQQKRDDAIDEIPKNAYGILADSAPVLVYGFSSTVAKCLKYYLEQRKKSIDVYVCEARTKTIYRFNNKLYHSDCIQYAEEFSEVQKDVAEALGKKNDPNIQIKITMLPDACASNLFSRGRISKVLLGANGISMAGRVGHTLGHLAIADMASAYNVPVFIVANSMKIGFFEEKPEPERENPWLTTDLKFESKIEEGNWKNCNPREDVLPPEKISRIITEQGIIKPTEIMEHADTEWLKGLSDLK